MLTNFLPVLQKCKTIRARSKKAIYGAYYCFLFFVRYKKNFERNKGKYFFIYFFNRNVKQIKIFLHWQLIYEQKTIYDSNSAEYAIKKFI